jgi:hypothetical protein
MAEVMGLGYDLSDKQKKFVKKVEKLGYEVDYGYSGRGMYGKCCPAVRVQYVSDVPNAERDYNTDQMGKSYVVYCR